MDILQKALKEGEQAEIVMDQDPIGSVLQQRAQAGKRWTDAAKNLMQDLKVGISPSTCPHVQLESYCKVVARPYGD